MIYPSFNVTDFPTHISSLDMRVQQIWVQIRVAGISSPRTRRMILLRVFRELRRALPIQPTGRLLSAQTPAWHDRAISIAHALGRETPLQRQGYELRIRRCQAGLTQSQLAAEIPMSRSHLARIERGYCSPSPRIAARLTQVLSDTPKLLPKNKSEHLHSVATARPGAGRANTIFDLNSG